MLPSTHTLINDFFISQPDLYEISLGCKAAAWFYSIFWSAPTRWHRLSDSHFLSTLHMNFPCFAPGLLSLFAAFPNTELIGFSNCKNKQLLGSFFLSLQCCTDPSQKTSYAFSQTKRSISNVISTASSRTLLV